MKYIAEVDVETKKEVCVTFEYYDAKGNHCLIRKLAHPLKETLENYIKMQKQQPCEDCIREIIREFDDKHPAVFADYMQEFNNHPISEIIEYMWDMHDLIEDIKYRLPNDDGTESEE